MLFSFSLNRTPLLNFTRRYSPSHKDDVFARRSIEFWKRENEAKLNALPGLLPSVIQPAGAMPRGTVLAPLQIVDIWLPFQDSHIFIDQSGCSIELHPQSVLHHYTQMNVLSVYEIVESVRQVLCQSYPCQLNNDGLILLQHQDRVFKLFVAIQHPSVADVWAVPSQYGQNEWQLVSPQRQASMLDTLESRFGKLVRPLITLVKLWNDEQNEHELKGYHLETITYHILHNLSETDPSTKYSFPQLVDLWFQQASRYYYDCPDPLGLAKPLHTYLRDDVQKWYVLMNRLAEAQEALSKGEYQFIRYMKS